jgi:hypothetical protein
MDVLPGRFDFYLLSSLYFLPNQTIMKKLSGLLFLLLLSLSISAQYEKMVGVLDDVESEMNDGLFTLRFISATNGEAVPDAKISISNNGDFTTDISGKVQFKAVPDGTYSFNFSKNGFISAVYPFEVVAGSIFFNRFSVCPKFDLGKLRIVLEWGRTPEDLDLHLVKTNFYHISFRDKIRSDDGQAWLDRDDMNGWGPETVTINETDDHAVYTCFVQDYTNRDSDQSNKLSNSKAVVRVYNNSELLGSYLVPLGKSGNHWVVFKIKNSQIQDVNIMGIAQ